MRKPTRVVQKMWRSIVSATYLLKGRGECGRRALAPHAGAASTRASTRLAMPPGAWLLAHSAARRCAPSACKRLSWLTWHSLGCSASPPAGQQGTQTLFQNFRNLTLCLQKQARKLASGGQTGCTPSPSARTTGRAGRGGLQARQLAGGATHKVARRSLPKHRTAQPQRGPIPRAFISRSFSHCSLSQPGLATAPAPGEGAALASDAAGRMQHSARRRHRARWRRWRSPPPASSASAADARAAAAALCRLVRSPPPPLLLLSSPLSSLLPSPPLDLLLPLNTLMPAARAGHDCILHRNA